MTLSLQSTGSPCVCGHDRAAHRLLHGWTWCTDGTCPCPAFDANTTSGYQPRTWTGPFRGCEAFEHDFGPDSEGGPEPRCRNCGHTRAELAFGHSQS